MTKPSAPMASGSPPDPHSGFWMAERPRTRRPVRVRSATLILTAVPSRDAPPVQSSRAASEPDAVRVAACDAPRARRRTHSSDRRGALPGRGSRVPVHRDRRGRGRDPRRRRQRDRPPRAVGLPRRAEPALRPDGVRHRGRHRAAALHRRRRAKRCDRCCTRTARSSDVVLSAFIARREGLQRVQGLGLEIVGPHSSKATMHMVDFARSNRLPLTWREPRARRRSGGRGTRGGPG